MAHIFNTVGRLHIALLFFHVSAMMDGQVFGDDPRKPIIADAATICESCTAVIDQVCR